MIAGRPDAMRPERSIGLAESRSVETPCSGVIFSSRRKAKVAVARKLAVILHQMWINGTEFT
jgi:hypothetical protein